MNDSDEDECSNETDDEGGAECVFIPHVECVNASQSSVFVLTLNAK